MESFCRSNGVSAFSQSVAVGGFLRSRPRVSVPTSCTDFRTRVRVPNGRVTSCTALRTRSVAALGDGINGGLQASAQAPEAKHDAAKLKEELLQAIEEAEQALDEKCLSIISSLEQLHQVPDVAAQPHLLKGCLVAVKAKFKENRSDGKQRYLGFSGTLTTLGPTTFNALKPTDLQIALFTAYQHVAIDSPDSYVLYVDVGIVDPPGTDPRLIGQIANRARFTIDESYTLQIEFLSSEIKPLFPETDLDAWLKVFKEAHPDMDENGFVSVPFPKPIKGGTDILYMDDEIRIHRGYKGGVTVLRVLKEPV